MKGGTRERAHTIRFANQRAGAERPGEAESGTMKDALGGVQSVLVLGGGSEIALATVRKLIEGRCRTVVLAGRDPEALAPAGQGARSGRRDQRGRRRVRRARLRVARRASSGDVFAGTAGLRSRAPRVRRARRPGARRDRRRGSATDHRVELHRRGLGARARGRARCASRVTAPSSCSRRSPASARGSRTSSTDRARPASTRSARGSVTASTATGVRIVVVRPGFVHTKMTEGLDAGAARDRPGLGGRRDRRRARARLRDDLGAAPLRYVMSVLRHIPRPVFRRLPL